MRYRSRAAYSLVVASIVVAIPVSVATLAVAPPTAGALTLVPGLTPDLVGTIYVADYGANSIDVFPPGANGNIAPVRTISGSSTGLNQPGDVKVDAAGDVFVANFSGNSITEYGPGASGNAAPICTISGSNTGLSTPDDISLAADGTLYVGNLYANTIGVFAPGACGNVAPLRTVAGSMTGMNDVDGVGVDAAGTLYADSSLNSSILVFAPGANGNVAPVDSIAGSLTGLSYPDDVIVGFFGELYVSNGFGSGTNSVEVFAPGASGNVAPLQNIRGSNTDFGNPDDLAVDASRNLYVTDTLATPGPAVLEFASGATGNVAPIAAITGSLTTLNEPEGVAVSQPPPPSLTTTASAAFVALGSSTSDTATLSGGNSPTGSLVFKLFGPSDPTCSSAPAFTSPPSSVAGNGTYPSPSFTPVAAGTYSWVALYSGDANNGPVSTTCGDPVETVTVKARTITPTGTPVSATEGQGFSGQVASFTDTNATSTALEYSATIDWGDATTSTGVVGGPTGGPYTIDGSHTYVDEGSYTVGVSITDSSNPANDVSTSSTATVLDAPLTAGALALSGGTEGVTPGIASFTFSDSNPNATTADYTTGGGSATVDWGDATTSVGVVSGPTGGPFTVTGSHQYTEEGPYVVTVKVTDDGDSVTSASGTTTVNDAALAAAGSPDFVSTNPVSQTLASFTDQNLGATTADFNSGGGSTTIDWGDATTSAGTVTQTGPGQFAVSGTHTYGVLGPYTITVNIVDDGGSTATAVTHVIVFAFPAGGDFVIGDGNSANGTAVKFWGAQWAKDNTLSGGPAPSSFKGFEGSANPPVCETGWTADPGNSTPPPQGPLPSYMGVIGSSTITKHGSTISGDIPGIVVVMTNSGYEPNPGHSGTGTVVAQVC